MVGGRRHTGAAPVAVSTTCAAADESPQVDTSRDQTWSRSAATGCSIADVSAQNRLVRSTPEPGLVPAKIAAEEAAQRRRIHMQKLEQLKEARRRGLPIQFEFDPADGPLPPLYYHLDGAEWSPG